MELEIKNKTFLRQMKPETHRAIRAKPTVSNPKSQEAEKVGRSTDNLNRELRFYQETSNSLTSPRGAGRQIYALYKRHGEQVEIVDRWRALPAADFKFHGQLRGFQESAIEKCLSWGFELLSTQTGSGKTTTARYTIAQRQQPVCSKTNTPIFDMDLCPNYHWAKNQPKVGSYINEA